MFCAAFLRVHRRNICRILKSSEIGCKRRWGASEIARRQGVGRQFVYQVRDRLVLEGELFHCCDRPLPALRATLSRKRERGREQSSFQ